MCSNLLLMWSLCKCYFCAKRCFRHRRMPAQEKKAFQEAARSPIKTHWQCSRRLTEVAAPAGMTRATETAPAIRVVGGGKRSRFR